MDPHPNPVAAVVCPYQQSENAIPPLSAHRPVCASEAVTHRHATLTAPAVSEVLSSVPMAQVHSDQHRPVMPAVAQEVLVEPVVPADQEEEFAAWKAWIHHLHPWVLEDADHLHFRAETNP